MDASSTFGEVSQLEEKIKTEEKIKMQHVGLKKVDEILFNCPLDVPVSLRAVVVHKSV